MYFSASKITTRNPSDRKTQGRCRQTRLRFPYSRKNDVIFRERTDECLKIPTEAIIRQSICDWEILDSVPQSRKPCMRWKYRTSLSGLGVSTRLGTAYAKRSWVAVHIYWHIVLPMRGPYSSNGIEGHPKRVGIPTNNNNSAWSKKNRSWVHWRWTHCGTLIDAYFDATKKTAMKIPQLSTTGLIPCGKTEVCSGETCVLNGKSEVQFRLQISAWDLAIQNTARDYRLKLNFRRRLQETWHLKDWKRSVFSSGAISAWWWSEMDSQKKGKCFALPPLLSK